MTQRKPKLLQDSGLKRRGLLLIEYASAPLFMSTYLIELCQVATIPSTDVSSRVEEVSEQAHELSTDTAKSHLNVSS